jgi:hypothetical protein
MSSVATELGAVDGVLGGYASSSDDVSFSPDAVAGMVPPSSIEESTTSGHERISRSAAMWFVFLGCSTNVVWNALQINVQYYALATSPPLGMAGLSALGTAQDAGTTVGVGLGLLFTIKASRDKACKACRTSKRRDGERGPTVCEGGAGGGSVYAVWGDVLQIRTTMCVCCVRCSRLLIRIHTLSYFFLRRLPWSTVPVSALLVSSTGMKHFL